MSILSKTDSVGIIGGADGPTAVFITGKPTALLFAVIGIAAVILLVVGIVLYIKKR